jgi:hypothetical protein
MSCKDRLLSLAIATGFWQLSGQVASAQETPNASGHRSVSPAVTEAVRARTNALVSLRPRVFRMRGLLELLFSSVALDVSGSLELHAIVEGIQGRGLCWLSSPLPLSLPRPRRSDAWRMYDG